MVQRAQVEQKKYLQGLFPSPLFAPTKKPAYAVVMIKVVMETDGNELEVWFAQVLFLKHLRAHRDVEKTEVVLVQYMEVMPPLDEVDRILVRVSVRWFTFVEMDYTLIKYFPTEYVPRVGERYNVYLLELLIGTAPLVRANRAEYRSIGKLLWSHHRFNINLFYKIAGAGKDEVEDSNQV